jgi:hypothetical protein
MTTVRSSPPAAQARVGQHAIGERRGVGRGGIAGFDLDLRPGARGCRDLLGGAPDAVVEVEAHLAIERPDRAVESSPMRRAA